VQRPAFIFGVLLAACVRMAVPVAQQGTLVVSGVIRADDTGNPLADVHVLAPDGSRAISDSDGEFQLPFSGPARLTILKNGYVRQVVSVAINQRAPLDIRLIRSAVITGRVLDDGGEPIIGAPVHIKTRRQAGNAFPARGETNDLGEYRVFGVAPGEYLVWVRTTGRTIQTIIGNQAAAMPSGRTVYYPGSEHEQEAQPVVVAAGDEHSGIDVVVPLQESARQPLSALSGLGISPGVRELMAQPDQPGTLRGRVVGTDGRRLAQAHVTVLGIVPRTQPVVLQADNNGQFQLAGLPIGRYAVLASKAGYFPSRLPTTLDLRSLAAQP
jgi:hypothetical protein